MAAIANGVAVVSNLGSLSESFWSQERPVALSLSPGCRSIGARILRLLSSEQERVRLATQGRKTYQSRCSVENTLRFMLNDPFLKALEKHE